MGRLKYRIDEALTLDITPRNRATVRRYYRKWRESQNIPERCDNPECRFHAEALEWNGGTLGLILDHENGNRFDNRPENLRLLCPNCDSQLETRGGSNRGRLQNLTATGFEIVHKDGRRDATVAPAGAEVKLQAHPPTVSIEPVEEDA